MITGFQALSGVTIIGFILGWVISSLSVYLAARIIGVQVSFLRALVGTLFVGIISFIIIVSASSLFTSNLFIIALIIVFVIALAIYKSLFNISWIKAFVILIIAGVIFFGIMLILVLILAPFALASIFSGLSAAP
jgi:hypothetical protein